MARKKIKVYKIKTECVHTINDIKYLLSMMGLKFTYTAGENDAEFHALKKRNLI